MCFAPQRRALFRHLNLQKWSEPLVFCTFWLRNVLRATTACTFSTSQLPKVVRSWCVFYILTSKCASRHNGVHLFDIATSKSGPTLVCFVHFDFEMCFAPQRRAIFHLSSIAEGRLAPANWRNPIPLRTVQQLLFSLSWSQKRGQKPAPKTGPQYFRKKERLPKWRPRFWDQGVAYTVCPPLWSVCSE